MYHRKKTFFFIICYMLLHILSLFLYFFSLFQCLLPLCFTMLYNSVLRWPSTSQLQCFATFQPLSLCPSPSRVTPIIFWARSTGATSACMRQGLCVVAWYSPFSWLGNNPHYNSLSHTHTHTHVNIYTVWHTHTHLGTLIYGFQVCRRKVLTRVGKHVKNRQELFFSSSVSGVFNSRTSTCFGYVQVLWAALSALFLSRFNLLVCTQRGGFLFISLNNICVKGMLCTLLTVTLSCKQIEKANNLRVMSN